MAVSVTRTRSESIRDWVEEREPFFVRLERDGIH